jgi:GntR family transcriptional regulator / MocR family aminotransferase
VPRTATPLNFTLSLAEQPGPAASRVSRSLIEALAGGQLQDGDRLPSTRTLAQTFGLARSAVVGAYEELTAAGFLAARPGGHTYVGPGAGAAARAGAFGTPLPPPAPPAAQPDRPVAYDLRPGLADPRLISERDWTRAMRAAAGPARAAVGPPDGGPVQPSHEDLRRELAGHLRRARGLAVDPDDVFLFPSVSVALGAVAAVCGLAGGQAAFEDPGYVKARLALGGAGVRIRPIPVDDDGIQARHLRAADRAVYVTPAHQYPLGGRMPVSRRAELLAWAAAHRALILEDDYDGEFRYGVPPLPPLRSMPGGADHVVYLGTSAKVLSRALRVSWAVLPARFRDAVRQHLDRSGDIVSVVSAALLCAYISGGALARHQARALRTYSARQRHFVAACRELIPGARALGIEAGLHVVVAFDAPFDDVEAAARLAGAGLACLPLSDFYAAPGPADRAGLVCGYSRLPETRARGAAQLIAQVVGELRAAEVSSGQTTGRPESRSTLRTDGETGVPGAEYSDTCGVP